MTDLDPGQVMTIEAYKDIQARDIFEKFSRMDCSIDAALKAYSDIKIERIKAQKEGK